MLEASPIRRPLVNDNVALLYPFNPTVGMRNHYALMTAHDPFRKLPPATWPLFANSQAAMGAAVTANALEPMTLMVSASIGASLNQQSLSGHQGDQHLKTITRMTARRVWASAAARPLSGHAPLRKLLTDMVNTVPDWAALTAPGTAPVSFEGGLIKVGPSFDALIRTELILRWVDVVQSGYFEADLAEDTMAGEEAQMKAAIIRYTRMFTLLQYLAATAEIAQLQADARILQLPAVAKDFEETAPGPMKKAIAELIDAPVLHPLAAGFAGSGAAVAASPYSESTTFVGLEESVFAALPTNRVMASVPEMLLGRFAKAVGLARYVRGLKSTGVPLDTALSAMRCQSVEKSGTAPFFYGNVRMSAAHTHAADMPPSNLRELATTVYLPADSPSGSVFRATDRVLRLTGVEANTPTLIAENAGLPISADLVKATVLTYVNEANPDPQMAEVSEGFSGRRFRLWADWQGEDAVDRLNCTVEEMARYFGLPIDEFLVKVALRPQPWAHIFVPISQANGLQGAVTSQGYNWRSVFVADGDLPLISEAYRNQAVFFDEVETVLTMAPEVELGLAPYVAVDIKRIVLGRDLPEMFAQVVGTAVALTDVLTARQVAGLQWGQPPGVDGQPLRMEGKWFADMARPRPARSLPDALLGILNAGLPNA